MDSLEEVEVFSENSAHYRYRVPLNIIRDLAYSGSRYSPEFSIGGRLWRFHLQQRSSNSENYLSLHLQSCSDGRVQAHFKLTVFCMANPLASKSKTFNCTFKKAGSAWGLHQFLPLEELINLENGYVYIAEGTGVYYIDFEVTLHLHEGNERSTTPTRNNTTGMNMMDNKRQIPTGHSVSFSRGPSRSNPPIRIKDSHSIGGRSISPNRYHNPQRQPSPGLTNNNNNNNNNNASSLRAALVYPYEHLEHLCDMSFDIHGVRIKAHRCIIGARMKPLLPENLLPLQVGCVVCLSISLDVFNYFLRYIYTEELPEEGMLSPEALLDLYLISSACEFYDLCHCCLCSVQPVLTQENILSIVLTRYNSADEVLTALYLQVLIEHYDYLIQEKQFEAIPGHLFRRLSLIIRNKEVIPTVVLPEHKNRLGRQLAWLAESGEYSDMELLVGPHSCSLKAHRFILASRSTYFSRTLITELNKSSSLTLKETEYDFSVRTWQKFLIGLYRHQLDSSRDFSAEDVAIFFKMHTLWSLDSQLKKEAEEAFNQHNALRILIYAVKHKIMELHERAIVYVANNFQFLIRNDPQAWDIISELPQAAIVALFRSVVEGM